MEDVAVFWDYENCPAPSNTSGFSLVNSIRSMAQNYGGIKSLKAYLGITDVLPVLRTLALRSELQSSGVSLIDCPHNGHKDVADKMMIVDMIAYAIDNAAPTTILLISGDRDFAYALSILRLRRYRIILCTPPHAHASLLAQASECIDWNDIILNSNNISSKLWAKPPSRAPIPRNPPQFFGALPAFESFQEAANVVAKRCNEPGTTVRYLQSVAQGATRRRQPSDPSPKTHIGNSSAYERPRQDTSTTAELKNEYIRPGPKTLSSPILLATQSGREMNTPYIPNQVLAPKTEPPNSSVTFTSYVSENSPGATNNHIRGSSTNSIPSTSITPAVENTPLPTNQPEDMPTKDQESFYVPYSPPVRPASAPNVLACPPLPPPLSSSAATTTSGSVLSDTTAIYIPAKISTDDVDDQSEPGKPEVAIHPESDIDSTLNLVPISPAHPVAKPIDSVGVAPCRPNPGSDNTVVVAPISPAHRATKPLDPVEVLSHPAPDTDSTLLMAPIPKAHTSPKAPDPAQVAPSHPTPGTDGTATMAPISPAHMVTKPPDSDPVKVVPSHFQILFRTLQTYKAKGIVRILHSDVGEELFQNAETYKTEGIHSKFVRYMALAEKQGFVQLGGTDEAAWISLKPDWYNAIDVVSSEDSDASGPTMINYVRDSTALHTQTAPLSVNSSESAQDSFCAPSTPPMQPILVPNVPAFPSSPPSVIAPVAESTLSGPEVPVAEIPAKIVDQANTDPQSPEGPDAPAHWQSAPIAPAPIHPDTRAKPPDPVKVVPPHFAILVRTLQTYKAQGYVRVYRWVVAEHVSQKGETYKKAGVSKYGQYVALAEKHGIIRLGDSNGKAWMALKPEWHDAIVG